MTEFVRCDTELDGNLCLFTGPHADHIAPNSHGQMRIQYNKTGEWRPMRSDAVAAATGGQLPPPAAMP